MTAKSFSGVIKALGAKLDEFEELPLPVYVLDRHGTVVWMNRPARDFFGDKVHHSYREVVPADFLTSARDHFARKILGSEKGSMYEADVIDRKGRRRGVCINSMVLSDGHRAVGVFGILRALPAPHESSVPGVDLSPRQLEVLRQLEAGASTRDISDELGISMETVRNHIRAVLRGLGVHSRLEAVVEAKRRRASTLTRAG